MRDDRRPFVWCVLAAVLGAIACGGGGQGGGGRAPATSPASKHSGSGVRAAGQMGAKKIIKPVLKAPSTADFPWDTVTYAKMANVWGQQRWQVSGAVDSQNSFGAMLREQWTAVVIRKGSDLMIMKVTLGDQVVYENSAYAKELNSKTPKDTRTAAQIAMEDGTGRDWLRLSGPDKKEFCIACNEAAPDISIEEFVIVIQAFVEIGNEENLSMPLSTIVAKATAAIRASRALPEEEANSANKEWWHEESGDETAVEFN